MSKRNGIVNLWDLPKNGVYLDLEEEYKIKLLHTARKIAGSWLKLANKINTTPFILKHFQRGHKISLTVISNLSYFLELNGFPEFSMKNVEKHITRLGSKTSGGSKNAGQIFNPKFPFNFTSPDGTRLISAFLHDGGINKNHMEPHYWNEDYKMRKNVYMSVEKVFGNISTNKSNFYENPVMFPKIIGVVLVHCLGMKYGSKVFVNPSVPKFIFNLDQEAKSIFLRQAFDDDATVSKKSKMIDLWLSIDVSNLSKENRENIKRMSPQEFAPKLSLGNKKLLENFGIKVNGPYFTNEYLVRKNDRVYHRFQWAIRVQNYNNLKLFQQKVNFSIGYKQKKMTELINGYKQMHYPPMEIYEVVFKAMKELQENGKKITKWNLARSINRSSDRAWQVLKEFREKGFIIRIHKGTGHTTENCDKYILKNR